MAINGPSMGIDEDYLTMIPSMGHRWTIDDPSMVFKICNHKTSFDSAIFTISTKNSRHSSFSVYLNFGWDFEDAQTLYSEMKLYIVIHIIYLCKKPDSVDFPRKKQQILRVKFLHISPIFSS